MLRLSFRTGRGEPPKLILASFLRFCADGTLRGPENYVVGRRAESGWWVGGILHRELECEGPLRMRLVRDGRGSPQNLGPFASVRAACGEFFGNDAPLHIPVPGLGNGAGSLELTLLSEGAIDGKTELPTRKATERSGAETAPTGKAAAQTGAHHGSGGNSGNRGYGRPA
jgi:hypothetical protein